MRVLGWILGVLLLLAGAAVGAAFLFDGELRARAEQQTAASLATSVPLENPHVSIGGTPIAWHLLTNRFPSVRVTADAMPLDLEVGEVSLHTVDATLTDVRPAADALRAATLVGTGRLTYEEVSRLAGTPITYAADQRISASGSMQVLGMTVRGTLSAAPVLDPAARTITLEAPQADIAGVTLPSQAVAALVDQVWKPVTLNLPYGLTLDSVTATPEGLQIGVTGADVTLPNQ